MPNQPLPGVEATAATANGLANPLGTPSPDGNAVANGANGTTAKNGNQPCDAKGAVSMEFHLYHVGFQSELLAIEKGFDKDGVLHYLRWYTALTQAQVQSKRASYILRKQEAEDAAKQQRVAEFEEAKRLEDQAREEAIWAEVERQRRIAEER